MTESLASAEVRLLDAASAAEGRELCRVLQKLAVLCQATGRYDDAMMHLERKLAAHGRRGAGTRRTRAHQAMTLVSIANVHRLCQRHGEALAWPVADA